MLKHGISFRPRAFWKNTEVSGIVCFGTPDALMIRSGLAFPSNACDAALYPLWKIRESSEILFYFCSYNPFTHAVELIRFSLYGQLNETSLIFVLIFFLFFLMLAIYGYDPSKGFITKKKV